MASRCRGEGHGTSRAHGRCHAVERGSDWDRAASRPRPTCDGGPDRGGGPADPPEADNGYFSEGNVGGLEARGFDPHLATGRQKHNQPQAASASGPPPEEATVKERMAYKLRTKEGRACYAKRKQIVEPVFGQIKQGRASGSSCCAACERSGGMEAGVSDA